MFSTLSPSPFTPPVRPPTGQGENGLPNREDILALWKNGIESIGESTVLRSSIPSNAHPTMQQVKGSGFAGAGSATVTGLLTTDVISCSGSLPPTCLVNGTLTFAADFDGWDVYVHRAGVLWAYWPGINVGKTIELDASGNGHHLTALTTTTITERLDGTGTDYCNESGFSARENLLKYTENPMLAQDAVNCWWKFGDTSVAVSGGELTITSSNTNSFIQQNAISETSGVDTVVYMDVNANTPGITIWGITTHDGTAHTTSQNITNQYYTVRHLSLAPITNVSLLLKNQSSMISNLKVKNLRMHSRNTTAVYSAGDSICAGAYHPTANLAIPAASYTQLFCHENGLEYDHAGVGGETLSQISARVVSALNGKTYDIVMLEGGINDINNAASDPTAGMITAIDAAIVAAKESSNIILVYDVPLAPALSTSNEITWTNFYNDYLATTYANDSEVTIVDTDSIINDYLAYDNVHPTIASHRLLADHLNATVVIPTTSERYPGYIRSDAKPVTGRQPAGFQSITDNQGPLRRDLIVTDGDTYPNITANAPLGPNFQAIAEWTNNTDVDLSTLTATANTRIGTRGVAIWNPGLDAAEIIKADRYLRPES